MNIKVDHVTERVGSSSEESCRLRGLQVGLHYEIALLEEGRALMASSMGACLKRRTEVLEEVRHLRNEAPPGEKTGLKLLALCKELREIRKRMGEIATEAEWLEMKAAGKKYTLLTVQQQHVVVSF